MRGGDNRSNDYGGGDMRGGMQGDYRNDYEDGKRGVKGTGPYGIGGSMYYPDRAMQPMNNMHPQGGMYDHNDMEENYGNDRRDMGNDMRRMDYGHGNHQGNGYMTYDYGNNDFADYKGEKLKLTSEDMKKWKHSMENADGTKGEHFTDIGKIMEAAHKAGVKFEGYDEKDLCLVVNMIYSDFCKVMSEAFPYNELLMWCVKFAKAWLEDKDAPSGGEKLAAYYYCIVEKDEEDELRRR
jgi:hypothetical protein